MSFAISALLGKPLDCMSGPERDAVAVAFVRAALRCVAGGPWGRLALLKLLAEELVKDEDAERIEHEIRQLH